MAWIAVLAIDGCGRNNGCGQHGGEELVMLEQSEEGQGRAGAEAQDVGTLWPKRWLSARAPGRQPATLACRGRAG